MLKTLLISLWLITHPVHVSLLSIDYVPEMVSFDVFIKVFYDDFLLDTRLNSNDIHKLNFSGGDTNTEDIIGKYINEKVFLFINEKQLTGKLVNMNLSEGELDIRLMFSYAKRVKTLKVKNLIMTSLYNDQSNMIIVRVNDFEEGVKLTSEKTEQSFKIN
jgi:hypothetical protein